MLNKQQKNCANLNPNFPKSIKIHSPVLQGFAGLGTVHERHHYSTRGLMFKSCASPKNTQLSSCTVMDLGQPLVGMSRGLELINPNHPKSFKILHMLLYDFGGFRLVECSYHVFTWGLMSQFCLSTKNVPFGYHTV